MKFKIFAMNLRLVIHKKGKLVKKEKLKWKKKSTTQVFA
jgi:hypothetical protein